MFPDSGAWLPSFANRLTDRSELYSVLTFSTGNPVARGGRVFRGTMEKVLQSLAVRGTRSQFARGGLVDAADDTHWISG